MLQLRARGERVVVLDDLSRGFRQAVLRCAAGRRQVGDRDTVLRGAPRAWRRYGDAFAAYTIVPESVRSRSSTTRTTPVSTHTLLRCCLEAEVRHFVFSSTAAVYGTPADGVAAEDDPDRAHQSLRHLQAHVGVDAATVAQAPRADLRGAALFQRGGVRYRGRIGQATQSDAAHQGGLRGGGRQEAEVAIFGTDYPRPTARGYATTSTSRTWPRAHLDALDLPARRGESHLKSGYGHGYSVREVLASVERVAGRPFRAASRRVAR